MKYHMYLLFENGIVLIQDIVDRADQTILLDDTKENQGIYLTPHCADIDYDKGVLLVDVGQKTRERDEHYIRQYHYLTKPPYTLMNRVLEGTKEKLRFFRNHVVEVKTVQKGNGVKGSELFVQDLQNDITVFWNNKHNKILQVEIEKDAIFYLAENAIGSKREKVLFKLFEMEDNIKIQTLMKMKLFKEAQDIAVAAKFPPEVRAEISKACGDHLYNNKKSFEEAIDKYIETIGYLNPSYVIQRYIQVPQLDNLIKYLEKLIKGSTGIENRTEAELASMSDYNKDYTALLLNCYVKKEKFQAI